MEIRERIIEEATDMFMKYGIKSTRMDDIATRLGVSKRTIYEQFDGGREALIKECVRCYHDRMHEKNEQVVSCRGNIIEQFMMIIDNWENLSEASMNFMTDLQRFYPVLFKEITEEHKKHGLQKLKSRLRLGIEQGLIVPDTNIDFAAAVLIETTQTVIMKPSSYEDSNISMEQAFKYVFIFFFRGISTPEGIQLVDELIMKNKNAKENRE